MRKKFLIVLVYFVFINCFSQEQSKLKFKSISSGFGINSGEFNSGGIGAYIDATTIYNKNLFSAAISAGAEFLLFDGKREFNEFAILFGKEIDVSKIIKVEVHTGIALFNEIYKNGDTNFETERQSTIGFPIKSKVLFYVTKHLAIGLNPNFTINSIENTFSGNVMLQYNFYKIR